MPKSAYPKMRWHKETGAVKRISSEAEDSDDYLDHHPNDPAAKLKVKSAELEAAHREAAAAANKQPEVEDLTYAEVKDALTAGGIDFKGNAPDAELRPLLVESLTEALSQRGTVAPVGANAKMLLAMVNGE